jgi:riboflavin synthase
LGKFEMIDETTKKTDLGNLKIGSIVNIERSLKAGDGLEGHFVLGHVDGVATLKKIQKKPKEVQIWFEVPKKLARYIVKKGSIAIDGISFTVVNVKKNLVSVCLIPHTVKVTNFKTKKIGDKINIETDILGKYILKQT